MIRIGKAGAPIVIFAIALATSFKAGQPSRLPGSAMGSVLLLHIERAAVALGAIGTVWLVGWRALHGHFPIKFGNVEYANELQASADTAHTLEGRLDTIEEYLGLVDPDDNRLSSD